MDKKTTAIIATVATVVLCGFPGLISLCMGIFFAAISYIPGAQIDVLGSHDPRSAFNFGIGGFCLGILLILIPVVVGFLTLRNKSTVKPGAILPPDEPIPPAS
jgi:hypothetical protein